MSTIGNTGQEPQSSSDFLINIQPPTAEAAKVLDKLQQLKSGGPTGTGRQTYYDDSVASSGTQEKDASTSTTSLDTMPPPDDVDHASTASTTSATTTQSTAVAGAPGAGNPFLNANPLVAYFIDFNNIAVMLRQMTNSQAHLTVLEMGITNDMAHGEAQKILEAAHAESKMYLAAAITSFTEAGVSLATGLGSFAAERAADKQMESASQSKQTAVDDAQTNVQTRQNELTTARQNYEDTAQTPAAQKKLQEAKKAADADPENTTGSHEKLQEARDNLEKAKLADKDNQVVRDHKNNLEKAEQNVDESQSQLKKAQRDKEEFQAKFLETRYSMSSSRTFRLQMAGEFIKKSTDGAANIVKSIETIEKGQAEAIRALYQSYQQNAQRMIDSLNSARSENSKMISELFQLLRKFSDDTRKLGGTLTAQSAS